MHLFKNDLGKYELKKNNRPAALVPIASYLAMVPAVVAYRSGLITMVDPRTTKRLVIP